MSTNAGNTDSLLSEFTVFFEEDRSLHQAKKYTRSHLGRD